MLTERRMQKIIDKLIKNVQVDMDVLDMNGLIVASSDASRIGELDPSVREFAIGDDDAIFIDNNRTFTKFVVDKNMTYFLSVEGTNRVARNYSMLIVSMMDAYLKSNYQRLDKEEVMRRILLGQLGELDLQELVRDYKLELGLPRAVFVIRTFGMEAEAAYQILIKAFPRNQGDILVPIDGMTVSLVKAMTDDMDNDELLQLGSAIEETIENEASIKAYIGIGNVRDNLFKLGESYNEAENAIAVGKIFSINNRTFRYDSLLLERFLHKVPIELCEQYSKIMFTKEYKKLLNEEMITTIDKFFENSLNLRETARQLFIHRNTLVYRLDKVQRIMGLDLRNFHDAVTFKIMMMLMDRYVQEC